MIELKNQKGNSFDAYIAEPKSKIKGGIILIHEVWGLVDHIKDVANRFAEEGYCVIAPELIINRDFSDTEIKTLQACIFDPLKRDSVQTQLRRLMAPINQPEFEIETISNLKSCFDYLFIQKGLQNIAISGFCFGGTYSYSFSAEEPRLKLAIPFYGHCNLNNEKLKQIQCPIRAFYGINDHRLVDGLEILQNNMKNSGVDFTAQVYPNCAHAFFNDTNHYSYNESASQDAWSKTLKYLAEFL